MNVNLRKYRKVLVLGPLCAFACVLIGYQFKGAFLTERKPQLVKDSLSRLNTQIPRPSGEEKEKNKLEIYMQSQQDSIKRKNEQENPSVKRFFDPAPPEDSIFAYEPRKKRRSTHSMIQQEKRVNEQLNKILNEVNSASVDGTMKNAQLSSPPPSADIDRLDQLIKSLQMDSAGDPELKRLDAMLNKIIQIQNPDANRPDSKQNPDSLRNTYPITLEPESRKSDDNSIFFGLDKSNVSISKQRVAIRAVVQETQVIQNGSTIKLRLIEPVYINQLEIPAGNFIYGTCSISDERLFVKITQVVYNNTLFPTKLSAYDSDGIAGINIPGAITRDATKEGIDRTIQTLTMSGFDGTVAAQATNAGIQSLSSLLRKKVKQIKVTIKAGHQVYLQ